MAGDPRVQQLLEEVLESRRTPEEVCRDCPELLPEVRLRWQRLESIQARIGALLPEPESTSGARRRAVRGIGSTIRRTSPATRWRRCSATAGWGSSTGPSTPDSTGPSPSRCSWPAPTPARGSASDSSGRPRRPPACATPTSCRSTTSATTTAGPTSPWSSSRAAAWPSSSRARLCRPAGPPSFWPPWPRPCRRPTRVGSSTATSSRRTSSSPRTARPRSPTSAWRGGRRGGRD